METKYDTTRFERVTEAAAPDLLSEIMKQPVTKSEDDDELFTEPMPRKKPGRKGVWISVAAAIAASIVLAILIAPNMTPVHPDKTPSQPKIIGSVIIDVNPSFKLNISEDLKVVSMKGLNDDGEEILKDLKPSESIDATITSVIDKLKEEKYITEEKTSILISYCYKNPANRKAVKKIIEKNIPDDLTCTYQDFAYSKALEATARKNRVSVGKYKYVENVTAQNKGDKKALLEMDINEITDELNKSDEKQAEKETEKTDPDNMTKVTKPNPEKNESKAERSEKNGNNSEKTNENKQQNNGNKANENKKKVKPEKQTKPEKAKSESSNEKTDKEKTESNNAEKSKPEKANSDSKTKDNNGNKENKSENNKSEKTSDGNSDNSENDNSGNNGANGNERGNPDKGNSKNKNK